MFGDHAPDNPALHHQHCMILLEDIDHRLHIHIRRNGGKSRFHEIPHNKEVGLVKALLLDGLYNHRLGNAPNRRSPFNDRQLGDIGAERKAPACA